MHCIDRGGQQGISKDSFCSCCLSAHFGVGVFHKSARRASYTRILRFSFSVATRQTGGEASKMGDSLLADTVVKREMLLWIRPRVAFSCGLYLISVVIEYITYL